MAEKKRIRAGDVARDMRSGMSDSKLMNKYGLSSKGLQSVFKKMVAAGILQESELTGRISLSQDTADITEARLMDRCYLVLDVTIHDADNPQVEGYISDISERGLQVVGIETKVSERKKFIVQGDRFEDLGPFSFEAECMWSRLEPEDGEHVAGFQITSIEHEALDRLRKLIATVALCD